MRLNRNSLTVVFTSIIDYAVKVLPEEFFKLKATDTQRILPRGMGKTVVGKVTDPIYLTVPENVGFFGKDLAMVIDIPKQHPLDFVLGEHTCMILPADRVTKEDIEWKIDGNYVVSNTGNKIRIALKLDIPTPHPALTQNVDFDDASERYNELIENYLQGGDWYCDQCIPTINVNDEDAYQQLIDIQMRVQRRYPNNMYRIFAGKFMSEVKNMDAGRYFLLGGKMSDKHVYFTVIQNEVPVVVGCVKLDDLPVALKESTVAQEACDNA